MIFCIIWNNFLLIQKNHCNHNSNDVLHVLKKIPHNSFRLSDYILKILAKGHILNHIKVPLNCLCVNYWGQRDGLMAVAPHSLPSVVLSQVWMNGTNGEHRQQEENVWKVSWLDVLC